jgi:diguanylate cyclase (GGDEF)-like protein/PAS domain S-box-containing protein
MVYTPFIWLLLFSAFITGGIAHHARRYQDVPSIGPFRILMNLVTAWSLLCALGSSLVILPLKIFIINVTCIPSVFSTLASLVLALEYTGNRQWLTRRRLALLTAISVVFLCFAFTSGWHQLWRFDYQIIWSGSVPVAIAANGPIYWFYISYMMFLIASTFVILGTAYRYRTLYFRNTLILMLGMLVPVIVGILYGFGLLPVRGFDWIPISFIWTGVLYGWAVLRGRLFDVVPVARNTVIENMDNLVIVLNTRGLLLDFNRAAQTALALSPALIGSAPTTLPQPWAGIFQRYAGMASCHEEILLELNGAGLYYDMTISPIQDEQERTLGSSFLFHDITKRKQAEADEREHRLLAEALRDTARALTSTLDFNGVLDEILKNVERVIPIDSANIALLDGDGVLHYVRFHGYEGHTISDQELHEMGLSLKTSPIYRRVYETGDSLIIPDTHANPEWHITVNSAWIRSYAVMPIRIKEKVVGFLNLDSAALGFYTPKHIHNLRVFADQVAVAIENARLYAAAEYEITERRQVEKKLRQLSRAVEQSPASIIITDIRGNIEYVNPRFTLVTGYSFEEALGRNPRLLKSGKTPPETYRGLWETIASGREWRGELINRKKSGEEYYESVSISPITDSQGVSTHYLAVKEDITGRKKAEEAIRQANQQLRVQLDEIKLLQSELREQAIRDPLTGLYNRRYLDEALEDELTRAEAENTPVSFVMIDIDHFKLLNDQFGHAAGDAVLKNLAVQLLNYSRASDIICRYGGEEFLAILPNVSAELAYQITERWRKSFLGSTLPLKYGAAMSTISSGIAVFPLHGRTGDDLISTADKAMYQAKALGRNQVVIWQGDPMEGALQT